MCSQMNMQTPCHMHDCFTPTVLRWASRTLCTRANTTQQRGVSSHAGHTNWMVHADNCHGVHISCR